MRPRPLPSPERRRLPARTQWIAAAALVAVLVPGAVPAGEVPAERRQFREARMALRMGQMSRFEALTARLRDYVLYPYLRYYQLRPNLARLAPHEVSAFVEAYPDSILAARLRRAWLERLAKEGRWPEFLTFYRPQEEVGMRCYEVYARIVTGRESGVAEEARTLWLTGTSQPESCEPAFAWLKRQGLLTRELVWERLRLAMAQGQPGLAQHLSSELPVADRPWGKLWLEAHVNPTRALGRPELRRNDERAREVAAHAIVRLAKRDVDRAHAELQRRQLSSPRLVAEVWRALALAAVDQDRPSAKTWLDKVGASAADAEVQRARLRYAILARDFATLARWTEQEPAPEMTPLRWRYWRARSLELSGRRAAAEPLYRELARERDYYGFAAADRLGIPYRMNDRPTQVHAADERWLFSQPAIVRARELDLAGYPSEARAEWNHAVAKMAPSHILLAAAYAQRWGWFDQVISALGKAKLYDDLELRFPMAFNDLVRDNGRRQRLDPALVFGVIRAESAFHVEARSSAGALGLMQLMPATARSTARHAGVALGGERAILAPPTNVRLGTQYLREMLNRYRGNLAMMAAAYNAGPGRVERWRPQAGCMDAELWVETIPFRETRRYVRNLFFYATVYEWRMGRPVTTVTARLGRVPARPKGGPQLACSGTPAGVYG
ncbi:MAG: transglycosylase SLT domain-containing protein [Gammaproteobacteria bacterium]